MSEDPDEVTLGSPSKRKHCAVSKTAWLTLSAELRDDQDAADAKARNHIFIRETSLALRKGVLVISKLR